MPTPKPIAEAAAVLAAGVLAGAAAYAALWPQSQIFGKVLIAPPNPNEIALTYDDGPNPAATERLLEVLARHEVRATFFLIGCFVRQRPDLARAIAAAGHLIGNHTMTHPWLAWQSAARIREEITGCNAILEDTLGAPVHYFRPPHGARRPYVLSLARDLGLATVQWNVTAYDWNPLSSQQIFANIHRGITRNQSKKSASNILLHDGGHLSLNQPRLATVEATDQLIRHYKQSNTRFVTPQAWT